MLTKSNEEGTLLKFGGTSLNLIFTKLKSFCQQEMGQSMHVHRNVISKMEFQLGIYLYLHLRLPHFQFVVHKER
jgi:hypothetical protein